MLLLIAEKKIPAGTRGYADSYVIQLDRPLYYPTFASDFTVRYVVKVSGDIGPLISEQLHQPALSERSTAIKH